MKLRKFFPIHSFVPQVNQTNQILHSQKDVLSMPFPLKTLNFSILQVMTIFYTANNQAVF